MAMAYGYNDAGHLHPVTDIDLNGTNRSFSYDLNGSMTTGYDLTDPTAVVSRGITYTTDNLPDSVTRGTVSTNFTYDGPGRRAKKTAGSNTTVYVNDLYEIINAAATKYIFAGNLRIAKIAGSDIKYFHKDHLGSSTVMTGASGLSVETSEYLPYGGNRDQNGTSVSDYKFTDQELDTSTGLYNYDARLYDPVIGRFITPDTIVPDIYDPQSLNRYSYCQNNPLIYTDPIGHYRDFGMGNDVVGGSGSSDTEDAGDQDILSDDQDIEMAGISMETVRTISDSVDVVERNLTAKTAYDKLKSKRAAIAKALEESGKKQLKENLERCDEIGGFYDENKRQEKFDERQKCYEDAIDKKNQWNKEMVEPTLKMIP